MRTLNFFFLFIVFLSTFSIVSADSCVFTKNAVSCCWNMDDLDWNSSLKSAEDINSDICSFVGSDLSLDHEFEDSCPSDMASVDDCSFEINIPEDDDDDEESTPTPSPSRGGGGGSRIPCTYETVCGEYGECIDGIMTRDCQEIRKCGSLVEEKVTDEFTESEACEVEESVEDTVVVEASTDDSEDEEEIPVEEEEQPEEETDENLLTGQAVTETEGEGNNSLWLGIILALAIVAGIVLFAVSRQKKNSF
ncbi:MAG: hypothetical protein ACLFPQ_01565 [Candidatus Woesearchaeota archaeon]